MVNTVVGVCVAVSLWDSKRRFGAMNHFLYPKVTDPARATPQYGNVATIELVNMMEKAGSRRADLIAQVLGGGRPRPATGPDVGAENVAVALEVLERKSIHIGSRDTGGSMGRKISFDTGTGHLMVLKVHKLREDDWNLPDPTRPDHDNTD
jgi:chemotaxis protein CheD